MNWLKLSQQQMILTRALSVVLVSFLGYSTLLVAQTPPDPPDRNRPSSGRDRGGASHVRFDPPPLPDKDAPGDRLGGASRSSGQCSPRSDQYLTALVPLIQKAPAGGDSTAQGRITQSSVLGLTTAEYPTFWFYIPYSASPTLSIEFVLQDEHGNELYQTFLTPSETLPGVVGFRLPLTEAPLELDKMYNWHFLVYCNRSQTPKQYFLVNGWVQRVALDQSLQAQLVQATPQERVALYAGAGIWHEALTALAELRRDQLNDAALIDDWTQLLEDVGLEAIAQAPIIAPMLEPKVDSPD